MRDFLFQYQNFSNTLRKTTDCLPKKNQHLSTAFDSRTLRNLYSLFFKSLSSLLEEMVGPSPGSDAIELQTELGSLVPGVLVPTGRHAEANVNITYPGQANNEIENRIVEQVFSSNIMRQLVGAGPKDSSGSLLQKPALSITAIGDSDSVTVNINLIGMTLFDHSEVCESLKAWQHELAGASVEKLEWRQRVGYETPDRVLGTNSRARVLHQLLLGLWGGLIEIEKGTPENPVTLIVRDANRQLNEAACPRIELIPNGILGGWSSLLASFERLLIEVGVGSNTFAKDVITQLLLYTPDDLANSQVAVVPQIVERILQARRTSLTEARDALSNQERFGNKAISDYKRSIAFWDGEFGSAWSYRNRHLFAASLSVVKPLD